MKPGEWTSDGEKKAMVEALWKIRDCYETMAGVWDCKPIDETDDPHMDRAIWLCTVVENQIEAWLEDNGVEYCK